MIAVRRRACGDYELLFGLARLQLELMAHGCAEVVDTDGMRPLQVRLAEGQLRVADSAFSQCQVDGAREGLLMVD